MGERKKAESRKILIADDQKSKIRDLIILLRDEGFQVTVRDSVSSAKEEIEQNGEIYEMIILDVMFFVKESDYKEDYDALTAGIMYILPVIKEKELPVIIVSAIPEEMVRTRLREKKVHLPDDLGYIMWVQREGLLPTQVLDTIEELHVKALKAKERNKEQ